VPVQLRIHEGIPHGFIRSSRLLRAAREAVGEGAQALRQVLHG
jgi:hypothetical protein